MIWVLLVVVLFAAGWIHYRSLRRKANCFPMYECFGWFVGGIIGLFIFFGITMGITYQIIRLNEYLIAEQQNLGIYEEEYATIATTLLVHLEKYPMEKEMFQKIGPLFLLKLPEIKSDKLLVAMAKNAVERQAKIFKCRRNINDKKAYIRSYDYFWVVPTVIRPKPEGLDAKK